MTVLGSGLLVVALPKYLSKNMTVETVNQNSVDVTTKDSYYSDKFRAETGYWFDLDIVSDGPSVVHVSGQIVKEIFKVEGTKYQYEVSISQGDVYQVQVENKKGHSEWFGFVWVPDDNHISGSIYLRRNVPVVDILGIYLLIPAIILIVTGISVVIVSTLILQQRKRKAELSRVCPHCCQIVTKDMAICPYCGFDVTKSVRCKHCDTIYDSSLYKCPNCGAKRT